jgi:hypothetical protein
MRFNRFAATVRSFLNNPETVPFTVSPSNRLEPEVIETAHSRLAAPAILTASPRIQKLKSRHGHKICLHSRPTRAAIPFVQLGPGE